MNKKQKSAALATLKKARELIKNSENWIQGDYMIEEDGRPFQYCAVGALQRANGPGEADAMEALAAVIPGSDVFSLEENIVTFNDDFYTTHKKVLNKFDKAIKMLEA